MTELTIKQRQWSHVRHLWQQEPDLRRRLSALWFSDPIWPDRTTLEDLAYNSIGVRRDAFESWYRSAWWGLHAKLMLKDTFYMGQADDVVAMVENVSELAIIKKAAAGGRGVVLLTAHVSAGHVPRFVLKKAGLPVKSISLSKSLDRLAEADSFIFVESPEERKTSLVKSLRHLGKGGILLVAPTGQVGDTYMSAGFLGHQLKVFSGASEIARMSGAPVFWTSATWMAPDRIRLIFEKLPGPENTGVPGWRQKFYEPYLQRLALQLRNKPADLGLVGGFWEEIQAYLAEL